MCLARRPLQWVAVSIVANLLGGGARLVLLLLMALTVLANGGACESYVPLRPFLPTCVILLPWSLVVAVGGGGFWLWLQLEVAGAYERILAFGGGCERLSLW